MIERIRARVPLLAFLSRVPPGILIALASFYLYLFTLAPDVLDSDGGELQFAAWNFSFVHPTGYPLFLLIGGVFQHLFPIGNPAFRLNLFNAMIAALAVSLLYIAVNEIAHHRSVAIIGAASFAASRTFWFNASGVEVYALNALFLALLIFLALRWRTEPKARTLAIFCLVCGLALTHHRTIVLWAPAFVLFFAITLLQNRVSNRFTFPLSPGYFVLCALLLVLPLSLYLYIPLRAPVSPYYQVPLSNNLTITLYDNSVRGFVNYVLGRTFQQEIRWDAISVARLLSTPQLLFSELGLIGIALGIAGLIALVWHREWALLSLTAAGFVVTSLFNAFYHIGDIAAYYIPIYMAWSIWVAQGVIFVLELVSMHRQTYSPAFAAMCLVLSALFIPAYQLFSNLGFADRSRETQPRSQWTQILSAPIPPNAILISNDRDEMMPLWYIQYVENTRRDLVGLFPLINPAPQYANVGRLTDSVLSSNRPIFFIKPMPGMEIKFRVEPSAASLVRVLGRSAEHAPQFASNGMIASSVHVIGYDAARELRQLRVAVYYQTLSRLGRNYTTFAQLLSVHGGKVAQGNDHQVGGDFYPTTLWQAGETLRDEYVIPLDGVTPGTYRLFVGMYRQPDLDLLGDAEIGVVEIE